MIFAYPKEESQMSYPKETLKNIHKNSFKNKKLIQSSKISGCFNCCKMFDSNSIVKWVEENDSTKTALYPYCYIDSVIPQTEDMIITPELLNNMHNFYFLE